MTQIVVVADDPLAVRANRFVLRHAAPFGVLATLDGRGPIRGELARLRPNLVLVNEMCQRANVLARIRDAAAELPDARIVVLSDHMDAATVDDAFVAGATAVVCRNLHPLALGMLLRAAAYDDVVYASSPSLRRRPAGRVARLRTVGAQDASTARTSA